jgi:glycosyltransferase involved in cell wall biosynthesis
MTTAELVPCCPESLRLASGSVDQLAHHVAMLEKVLDRKNDFDLIHFHIDYLHFPVSTREKYAHVSTLHGRLDIPDLVPLYEAYPDVPVVSISDAQREPLPNLNWQGTVHHGFPPDMYKWSKKPGTYLAFLGRTSPEKGLDRAIEIAKSAGMPLKVAAKIDKSDQEYFDSCIRPLLDSSDIEFMGEIGYPDKNKFLAEAAALVFPIAWPEPFGLVMIEAMACGTPVIAYPFGSVSEVMEDGVSGFVVPDIAGAVQAIGKIGELDRKAVRKHFEQRFTASRMTQNYLKIYNRLVSRKKAPLTMTDGVLNWMKLTSPSSTT